MNRRSLLKYAGLAAAARLSSSALPAACEINTLPPSILINQVGYLPSGAKVASVRGLPGLNVPFALYPVENKDPIFRGTLTPSLMDPLSGDSIAHADFSALTTPGQYRLHTANLSSQSIYIRENIYADALRTTMRAFYGQRCGCDVDLGGGYKYPACHLNGAYSETSGRTGTLPNHGGWHDAGDYGRYIVNSGITMGTLLWAWELYPQALQNLHLAIPESNGPLPDFLAEIRWNLNWMLSLQAPGGGVFHKQTSKVFAPFVMPQDDHLLSEVIGTGLEPFQNTCATADLAAVAAIAARVYRPYDAAFADRCLLAAKRAWQWAIAHPDVTFKNPPGITTGEYGDPVCSDEVVWASAELFRTTGDPHYEAVVVKAFDAKSENLAITAPSWANVISMAWWTYALDPKNGTRDRKEKVIQATQQASSELIARSETSGYGLSLQPQDYTWGSNSNAANQSLLLAIANHFRPDPRTQQAALGNLHYLFGRNCHGVSWVTQVGQNPFLHPHHRPSVADGIPAPWPGLLSGGPNARPGDATARTLPQLPPMRMWLDDDKAYSLNEVAINWNAPLVFLLGFASR